MIDFLIRCLQGVWMLLVTLSLAVIVDRSLTRRRH